MELHHLPINDGFISLENFMGNDLSVVNAARVSFNKRSSWKDGQFGSMTDSDKKLITFLAKNDHWTPFAHCQITLHIKAPISIRTQFFKHKVGFVENEVSRRYVDDPPTLFTPTFSGRPDNVKQGAGLPLDAETTRQADYIYNVAAETAIDAYNSLLRLGVAPEQARFVLPQGVYTEWYWTGSLAAYARFYKQRSDPTAQAEIREYAEGINKIMQPLFPVSWTALTQ